MPLSPNSKLGPYEIKSTLGVGGMGEVYRARDSRLNRDVAIKVLRQDSTSGSSAASADLRSRFEREARAVAALNHPNIIAVYDFGIESSQQYIVSELLEGESLRALLPGSPLKGKPLPVRRLVEIASQVADGLAAAHAAGIVHRDLKPENIMLTKDGRAKILDFGLARHAPATNSPAIPPGSDETFVPPTQNLTSAGAILGTAAYMSPEQALGQETGYRSDQFSFGLILYEMASGKQAFAKPSSVETMAAIVRDDPPPMEEKLPPPLRWIIDRCLAKEPDRRYESTRDLYRDLQNLRDHFSEAYSSGTFAPVATSEIKAPSALWRIPALCAACVALTALLVYAVKPSGQKIANYRYTRIATDTGEAIWSPDGKAIAYASKVDGIYQTFLRYLNSPVAVQLTHEKHNVFPMGWSTDKAHLVLLEFTGKIESPLSKLYLLATVGGDPEFIMDSDCLSCIMSPDGKAFIIFGPGMDHVYNVSVSDPLGSPPRLYTPAPFASKMIYSDPQLDLSPDQKNLLLGRAGDEDHPELWLLPYPAGGRTPKRILQNVPLFGTNQSFSWMPDSIHIVISLASSRTSPEHLWVADTESEKLEPITSGAHSETYPKVSQDGASLTYHEQSTQYNIVSLSVEDGSIHPLNTASYGAHKPFWAARQQKLIWVTDQNGSAEIWMRGLDGNDRPVVTAQDFPADATTGFMNPALSPDGDRLIYGRIDAAGVIQLWVSSLAGGAPVRLTNNPPAVAEYASNWSPGGKEYVFLQNTNGKTDLVKVRTGSNTAPVLLKQDVSWDFLPEWSPTGEWITYKDKNGIMGLIATNGASQKSLGELKTQYLAFSKDGKRLYGINQDQDRTTLFSLELATLKMTTIKELGSEWGPDDDLLPGIRFSLAPDGKSFVYAVSTSRDTLWMLTGYRQPGLWNQIKDAFHFSKPN